MDAPDYMIKGPGVTAEATRRLYELGMRVMGIDAWGWDAPLHLQAEEAKAKGEPGIFWAAHQTDLAYSQIERLVNLGSLPPSGFTVSLLPAEDRRRQRRAGARRGDPGLARLVPARDRAQVDRRVVELGVDALLERDLAQRAPGGGGLLDDLRRAAS